MGKVTAERRHAPLADDILSSGNLRTKSGKRKSRGDEEDGDPYVDSRTSKKILQIGQELANEDEAEMEAGGVQLKNSAFAHDPSRFEDEASEDEDDVKYDEEWGDVEEEVEEADIDPSDLDMFHKFVPRGETDPIFGSGKEEQQQQQQQQQEGTNLADLILEKIAAFEAKQSGQPPVVGDGPPEGAVEVPTKVVEVYEKVGFLLSRYKSGAFPKPFKVIPSLPHWQIVLSITQPENWTPNAVYMATRLFISSKPQVAQEFINTVLLERVRDDIRETKKLNVHVYNALRKALYKPACFFKGLLFPLVGSGTCTLREAHIVSSVIARVSIPVLHSAAALLRMCDIAAEQTQGSLSSEGTGAVNIFIRIFLEKKYALPYKVIDSLVFHFLRFRVTDTGTGKDVDMSGKGQPNYSYKLPVLWHQSLLVFAQRYRNDITEDQREALLDLLLVRGHKDIGPEVRRELLAGRGRGIVPPENGVGLDNDDTMDVAA